MKRSAAPPASTHSGSGSLLLKRAHTLTSEVAALVKRSRADQAAIALRLRTVKNERLYSYLGYPNIGEYALREFGLEKSKCYALIGICESSERLPRIKAAFEAGELPWTKAREIAGAATPETEQEWLRHAETLGRRALADLARGEDPQVRRSFTFSEEQGALFDQLLEFERERGDKRTDASILLDLMERGLSEQGGRAPVRRVVIKLCPDCEAAESPSRSGPLPVGPASVEAAKCGGEVVDLREKGSRVTRKAPAHVQRRVLDRDGGCRAPGCNALGGLDVHHEDGWKEGHDPERMLTLCSRHHLDRHLGLIRIVGSAPDFRFENVDGKELRASVVHSTRRDSASTRRDSASTRRDSASTRVDSASTRRDSASTRRDSASTRVEVLEEAKSGLRSLGFAPQEARTLLVRVAGDRGAWTLEDLLGAALRAS